MGERPRVALLGLGIMGWPMAERILEQGFALAVWNRTAAKAQPLAQGGAEICDRPEDVARGAAIVCSCLTDASAVEEVLLAPAMLAALAPDATVLDFSTIGIGATRAFAARLGSGRAWVDAPVSGGPAAARAGTLIAFCGGTAEAIAKAAPLLDAMTQRHTHMGPVGAGQAAKLCNQLIVSSTVVAISEAIAIAAEFGLNAELLPAALAGGWADSLPLQIFGPRMAAQQLEPRTSQVATMRKDIKTVLAEVAEAPIDLRFAQAVAAIYELAVERGFAELDLAVLPRLVQR